ncbi:MerR family transcriptional regulator [Vibrio crassostreae]|uniref:MerR family transcriptional regulator n=1 Tax=Vibrio crassostreae TaxID=246167 RepID=UPI001B313C58|nr:MerR family DNA-binding transcriptional regulator [Vibrio crassostreae]
MSKIDSNLSLKEMIKVNKYLTIGETAEMLGVSVPTIRRWQRAGKIQESHRTAGNHRRFPFKLSAKCLD